MRRPSFLALGFTGILFLCGSFITTDFSAPRFVTGTKAVQYFNLGTLAPKSSPIGKMLQVWETAVKNKSGGALELKVFYNGVVGDEAAMIGKMKSGQLDGALLSAAGLSKAYKPIGAMRLPGLFRDWAKFNGTWEGLRVDMEKGLTDAGFTPAGFFSIGKLRWMTKGYALPLPEALKGKKPWQWRDELTTPLIYQTIGGVTPVPLSVPEVLPNLNTGAINTVFVSALLAEQWQWAGKLDNISAEFDALDFGGIIFSGKSLNALSEEQKKMLLETGKTASAALHNKLPLEDDAAYNRLKGKMTVGTRSADNQVKWTELYKQVRIKLGQGAFTSDLVSKIESLAK